MRFRFRFFVVWFFFLKKEREREVLFFRNCIILLHQAVSCLSVTSEAWILYQTSPHWVFGGDSGTTCAKFFLPVRRLSTVPCDLRVMLHTDIFFSLHGRCIKLAIDSVVKLNTSLCVCHVMLLFACAVACLLFAIKVTASVGHHWRAPECFNPVCSTNIYSVACWQWPTAIHTSLLFGVLRYHYIMSDSFNINVQINHLEHWLPKFTT
jgi:hypothetical protein